MSLTDEEQVEIRDGVRVLVALKNEITTGGDLPWSGALLKIADIHKIASDLRDGFTGGAQKLLDSTPAGLKRGIAALRQNTFNALGNTVAIGAAVGATVKKAAAPGQD